MFPEPLGANMTIAGQPFERIQRSAESFESATNGIGCAAEAQPKVLRLLEELTGHDAGFELLAQQLHEIRGVSDAEPRKNRGAETAGLALELWPVGKELVDQYAVGLEQVLRTLAKTVKVVEGDDRNLFRRVDMASVGEVDDLPHPPGCLGLGENPTAADTAEPVGLRQATGDNEVRA